MLNFIVWYFIIGFVLIFISGLYMLVYAKDKVSDSKLMTLWDSAVTRASKSNTIMMIMSPFLRIVSVIMMIVLIPIWVQISIVLTLKEVDKCQKEKKESSV